MNMKKALPMSYGVWGRRVAGSRWRALPRRLLKTEKTERENHEH
jgi:hypothetical protein